MAIAKTFEPLAYTSLTANAASITFSNISSSYTDLYFVFNGYHDTGLTQFGVRYNGDNGVNYNAVGVGQTNGTSTFSLYEQNGLDYGFIGWVTNGDVSMYEINLNSYTSTVQYKNTMHWGSTLATRQLSIAGATWRSTAAITSVVFRPASGNFATNTTITMYGIKKA